MRLVQSEDYRGYMPPRSASLTGFGLQLLATREGIPVEFAFLLGEANDVRGLNALPLQLLAYSEVYADAAYTDYQAEDDLQQTDSVAFTGRA